MIADLSANRATIEPLFDPGMIVKKPVCSGMTF